MVYEWKKTILSLQKLYFHSILEFLGLFVHFDDMFINYKISIVENFEPVSVYHWNFLQMPHVVLKLLQIFHKVDDLGWFLSMQKLIILIIFLVQSGANLCHFIRNTFLDLFHLNLVFLDVEKLKKIGEVLQSFRGDELLEPCVSIFQFYFQL